MQLKNVVVIVILALVIQACDNNDIKELDPIITGDYKSGILISNEGPFNNGTGTVSFISDDLETVENAIYNKVNNDNLGNIVQSIGFTTDKAYVIANNSNTITVVDRFSFEKETVITNGLNNPRYFVAANGMGYVTNWGDPNEENDDFLAVIDLSTNMVINSIPLDFGPEEIVGNADDLYVAHQGGFGQNNIVSVFNASLGEVTKSIDVGDIPNSMQLDGLGNLWVLCGGKPSLTGEETAGSLVKIVLPADRVETQLDFEQTEHPNHLTFDGTDFYFSLGGAIYSMNATSEELPTEKAFDGVPAYAMTVKDGKLYTTDAKDFASNGSLSIYDLITKEEVMTFELGIIPGGIYFN